MSFGVGVNWIDKKVVGFVVVVREQFVDIGYRVVVFFRKDTLYQFVLIV